VTSSAPSDGGSLWWLPPCLLSLPIWSPCASGFGLIELRVSCLSFGDPMSKIDYSSYVWAGSHVTIYVVGILLVISHLVRAVRKDRESADGTIVPPPDSPIYAKD
jgi:hypothetical protein